MHFTLQMPCGVPFMPSAALQETHGHAPHIPKARRLLLIASCFFVFFDFNKDTP
jgi:hypothetical protein